MSPDSADRILERARKVLEIEGNAILEHIPRLGGSFVTLVRRILALQGRVAVCGVGKSGTIGEKIVATLASTGTPALILRALDAIHGDLGMLSTGDLLIAISHSGETVEILRAVNGARALGVERPL